MERERGQGIEKKAIPPSLYYLTVDKNQKLKDENTQTQENQKNVLTFKIEILHFLYLIKRVTVSSQTW